MVYQAIDYRISISGGQSNSKVGSVFALHISELGSNLGIQNCPLNLPGLTP